MNILAEIMIKDVGTLELNTKDVEDFGIPLIFTIADIKNFGSRKSSFSKTIKVLGSKNNNRIFNHLYEIKGAYNDFDMTLRHNCVLMVNKTAVMDGFMALRKITKVLIGNNYEVVYELNLYSEVKTFFDLISDKDLIDLDYSSGFTFGDIDYEVGDHILTPNLVGNRMQTETTPKHIYTYPLVDYGYDVNGTYPIGLTTATNLMYPAVYTKAIFDKIFYDAGYTYESDYLNGESYSGFFTEMVNIYNKQTEFKNLNLIQANSDGGFTTDNIGDNPRISPGYQCVMNGINYNGYTIDLLSTYETEYQYNGIKIPYEGDYRFKWRIEVTDDEGGEGEGSCPGTDSVYKIMRYRDGVTVTIKNWSSSDLGMGFDSPSNAYYEEEFDLIECEIDDIYWFRLARGTVGREDYYGNCEESFINVTCDGTSLELTYLKELNEIYSGGTANIYINEMLPEMSQIDFIKNQIKIANLYIWSNAEDPKKLYIEPRDKFYQQGEVKNWDRMIDYNKKITIQTLNNDIAGEINFLLAEGEDFYTTEYRDIYAENYGTKKFTITGKTLKDSQSIELDYQSYIMKNGARKIYPALYEESMHTWFEDRMELEPLMGFLYRDTAIYKLGRYSGSTTTYNDRLTSVPYATHASIFGGFSYDLNYETNNEEFTLTNYDPKRGLYNIFWENYTLNMISSDSRVVTYYIDLSLSDILKLDFRDQIFIDGQLYFLEKVEYDPSNINSSKVTLLKEIAPLGDGKFPDDSCFLLLNDSGDYILTHEERLPIRDRIIIC